MTESYKTILIPNNCIASEKMINEFIELIDFIDPKKLSRKLRMLTLNFVANQSQDLTDDLPEFLDDLNILFDFFDAIEDELSEKRTA